MCNTADIFIFLKRSHASTLSIWTEEIQAMSEEWTTQTEIYCDTFGLQSFGTRNSYLVNTKFMFCTGIALFYFVSEGDFQVQAPGGLDSEGWFNGFAGLEGLYLEGLTWTGLFSEFYGNVFTYINTNYL